MAKELIVSLPPDLAQLPETARREILDRLQQALDLPKEKEQAVVIAAGKAEHNIWARNGDPLMADLEDALYIWLVHTGAVQMAEVFAALDLDEGDVKDELQKAFSMEYRVYEDELIKAKGKDRFSARRMFADLVRVAKEKRETFMKYLEDGGPLNRDQRRWLDKLLKKELPKYAEKDVEALVTRAGLIGKIRNTADREAFDTMGAVIDRWPETVKAAETESVVLTVRQAENAASEGRKVTVLPLTPEEARAVEHAAHSAADKITEVSERHASGIKQLVQNAKKQRWSAQRLAQELYDMYGDQNRDWRRVAITELAMAANDAFLSGQEEGATVVGSSAADACKHCTGLVSNKTYIVTNDPKQMTDAYGYTHVWPGKSNFGRRAANYWPCVPMHPHCRCRWVRLSNFYKVDESGKQVRKTTAELIQEERRKRGMDPDPNL